MDFFRNDGLFQTIVTLPSVLSARCVSRRIDTWHIVYLSNKDPCPKILVHKSEIKVPYCHTGSMDSDGNSRVSASKKWLALAELPCNWQ